ncbi:CDP-diacylglycerol--serine O-phosphatidyltransferase [Saccharobesus litoralis]|uniref:CDP-diacylglycerol--serine O-phosphatidyltransferase n=1 Tax=Saccharobesus litoralis TaxID=2172099 RepID=A0A2S0VT86_9ALTE|nr:CDP-diacylglycerol--serine O-phosphatidyltransferase [Saccharobesus litoralis]AWB67310.1 CDP-diacylglycerol--serine O-phosphatidyltransferase [Saccharobesus litoralis]
MSNKRRGVYLLPNVLTTGGLFSGFYAVIASMNHQFESAAVAIFIAMIFDALDGRVARITNTQSAFGAEYDSMADMISFGIAPAIVAYNWALVDLGKAGWLAAFVYTAGAALRLARFNTTVGTADTRFFQGLASPAAAAIVAGMVWVGSEYEIKGSDYSIIAAIITVASGLLMVSNFKYSSFKEVDWKAKVPFIVILVMVLAFIVVATEPALVLFIIFSLYALSGPILTYRSEKSINLHHLVGEAHENDHPEDTKDCEAPHDKSGDKHKKVDEDCV